LPTFVVLDAARPCRCKLSAAARGRIHRQLSQAWRSSARPELRL